MTRNRIGLIANAVHPQRFGGAETYARELVRRIPLHDPENDYVILLSDGSDADVDGENATAIFCRAPVENAYLRVSWEQVALPFILRRLKLDLVHFLGSTASFAYRRKGLVTIHDTLRYQLPKKSKSVLAGYYELNQRSVRNRGYDIIAVSRHDAEVMCVHLALDPQRVHVIPLGVGQKSADATAATEQRAHLVWVGHPYPHKNLPRLIEAYRLALPDLDPGTKLRLIGIGADQQNEISALVTAQQLENSVCIEPPLKTSDITSILSQSAVLCLPSQVESFGLPILEALSCGASVACSNLPAFRELFEDHVHRAKDDSAPALATAIREAYNESRLSAKRKSHQQFASTYNWTLCAQRTIRVYHSMLAASCADEHDE